ncbi:MAG: serine acetyltransferase [Oscillospiraceae bacterium]|nr:serine acetyltransferase [Oscillospiraceae bacterium]
MNRLFIRDYERYTGKAWKLGGALQLIKLTPIRFLFVLRKTTEKNSFFWRWCLRCMREKYGLDISQDVAIGAGLALYHPYCIAIHNKAVIGENVNISKGVTIGYAARGDRCGAPVVGSKVWIGPNAAIVGKVVIGDDVLIAPNSYVNCDVPSHSIVLGNPCRIVPRENATEEYIIRTEPFGGKSK